MLNDYFYRDLRAGLWIPSEDVSFAKSGAAADSFNDTNGVYAAITGGRNPSGQLTSEVWALPKSTGIVVMGAYVRQSRLCSEMAWPARYVVVTAMLQAGKVVVAVYRPVATCVPCEAVAGLQPTASVVVHTVVTAAWYAVLDTLLSCCVTDSVDHAVHDVRVDQHDAGV